jgi:sulfite exporter TauE/SafE
MCGAIMFNAATNQVELWLYHFGRLLGYASLGAAFGWVGKSVLSHPFLAQAPWAAALILSLAIIFAGIQLMMNRPLHLALPRALSDIYRAAWSSTVLNKWRGSRALFVGLLSIFLPCGWLYGFLLSAVAMKSATGGAALMAVFWLGTLPALTAAFVVMRRLLVRVHSPRAAGLLLVLAGLATIGVRAAPLLHPAAAHEMPHHCALHHE